VEIKVFIREKRMRNYEGENTHQDVKTTYALNHQGQTVSFVDEMKIKYCTFDKATMSVWDAAESLEHLVDASDPDFQSNQSYHAYLTAEDLKRRFPDEDWLHLVGFIHDLGKVLLLPQFGENPQWAVVGDTFPVGCAHAKEIVHAELFSENKDTLNSSYNTTYGIYEPNCGLSSLKMSWGHDEYLYQVLQKNNCTLPKEAKDIIRFHSFYAWHSHGAYRHLMKSPEDEETLLWINRFNASDLYSKSHELFEQTYIDNTLRTYYQGLIEKYFPQPVLSW